MLCRPDMGADQQVKRRRSREPILWVLFGGGGMMSALFLPILVAVLFIASPLELIELLTFGELQELVRLPLVRLALFGFVFLSFFHWAHRCRYTIYDTLQVSHLGRPIALLTYGIATTMTLLGAWVLWGIG